jgi:hypothetical protein
MSGDWHCCGCSTDGDMPPEESPASRSSAQDEDTTTLVGENQRMDLGTALSYWVHPNPWTMPRGVERPGFLTRSGVSCIDAVMTTCSPPPENGLDRL